MVKIVTGVRRCGKSFLLFNIFVRWLIENGVAEDHVIGLSLDDFRNRRLRQPEVLLDYIDEKIKVANNRIADLESEKGNHNE